MMKKKSIVVLTLVIIIVGGVLLYPKIFPSRQTEDGQSRNERKVLYWTDPMMPGFKSEKPGKSPMGMDMVPVYDTINANGETTQTQESGQSQVEYYTCPMHPQVRQDKPGNCSICSMKLTPVMRHPTKGDTAHQGTSQHG